MTPVQHYPNAELVEGYAWTNDAGMEVLGAVFADGTLAACNTEIRSTVHFNKFGRVWTKIAAFPDNASWIGYYPANMKVA